MNLKTELNRYIQISKEFGSIFAFKSYSYRVRKNKEKYICTVTGMLNNQYLDCLSNAREITSTPVDSKRVWSFWWQGFDSLPEVLKITYKSHVDHIKSSGFEYVLIDKDNLNDYLEIPEYIQSKVNNGIISFTHFSDYIRIALLQKYGGLWVDITLLMVNDLPKEMFDYPFYSVNLNGTNHKNIGMGQKITNCKWAGFMLGSNEKNNTLLTYVKLALEKYWQNHNIVVDYFLMNLLILCAYQNDISIKECIDAIPQNNIYLYELQGILNSKFDDDVWQRINKNQVFFKVTQKMKLIKNNNGDMTFYGFISNL